MSLSVAIRHRQGQFTLDATFETAGRLTAIFGASGSGKTTLVNAIAGLVKPEAARIVVDGQTLTDTAQGISLAAHRRRIGYVFQDARLFPHLSVEQNLGYGRWFVPPRERYVDRGTVLSLLGIAHLLKRRPGDLSGGERQRVAIGRALLASPRLLLMDEPLASLDQARKAEILPFVERLRDEIGIPIVFVSHSASEVLRLATDIVTIAEGRVTACGPAAEVAQRLDAPDGETADEAGALLDMTVATGQDEDGMTRLLSAAGEAFVQGRVGAPGTRLRVRVKARDVMLATTRPQNISALNVFEGRITRLDAGDSGSVLVSVDCAGAIVLARVTRKSALTLNLAPGIPVFAVVKAMSVGPPGAVPRA